MTQPNNNNNNKAENLKALKAAKASAKPVIVEMPASDEAPERTVDQLLNQVLSGNTVSEEKTETVQESKEETPEMFKPLDISSIMEGFKVPTTPTTPVIITKAFPEAPESTLSPEERQEVNGLLDQFGLNWKVEKLPMLLPDGQPTGYFATRRDDTKKIFNALGESYTPFQNDLLAEMLLRISKETGYGFANGGSFDYGARVYLQLETGEMKGIGENSDTVKKYATALNAHDGTMSLKWGHSNTVISCMNTFNRAAGEVKSKALHTASIFKNVEESLLELEALRRHEQIVMDRFKMMATMPATQKNFLDTVKLVTSVDLSISAEELRTKYNTFTLNKMHEFVAIVQKEMKQKGGTAWGLFNGVTKWTTYEIPVGKKAGGREESKFKGNGFKLDNQAFALLAH